MSPGKVLHLSQLAFSSLALGICSEGSQPLEVPAACSNEIWWLVLVSQQLQLEQKTFTFCSWNGYLIFNTFPSSSSFSPSLLPSPSSSHSHSHCHSHSHSHCHSHSLPSLSLLRLLYSHRLYAHCMPLFRWDSSGLLFSTSGSHCHVQIQRMSIAWMCLGLIFNTM